MGFTFLLLASLLMAVPAYGHTFHTSLTRLDYKAKKKLVEITMRVFIHDLVPLLEKTDERKIDLEKTPDVDAMIAAYIKRNFEVKDKAGVLQNLVWVGKEMDVDNAFLYFEIPVKESPEGYSVKNTIFFESFPEQTNRLVSRYDRKKCDLVFVSGDEFKELLFKSLGTKKLMTRKH